MEWARATFVTEKVRRHPMGAQRRKHVYCQLTGRKKFHGSSCRSLARQELSRGEIVTEFTAAAAAPICLWKCIPWQSEPSSDVDFYYQRNMASHREKNGLGGGNSRPGRGFVQVLRHIRNYRESRRHPLVSLSRIRAKGRRNYLRRRSESRKNGRSICHQPKKGTTLV
jgi:hypothetical protein